MPGDPRRVASVEQPHVLAIVLAGGQGTRLAPLTRDRAKPAVPFGGQYRLIDFVLSNLVNAGFRRVVVLTQYKSHSLDRHLAQTWSLSPLVDEYVASVPAQMRRGPRWFSGSADAIYQNLNIIQDERPHYVLLLGADHIYRMDCREFLQHHIDSGAGVTVAARPVAMADAGGFGIIELAEEGRIASFQEKPLFPSPMPDDPTRALASMGNYVFTTEVLTEAVARDAVARGSTHDVGGDIVPMLVGDGCAGAYDFTINVVPGQTDRERGYWRDVGTIDAYYEASMDLVAGEPVFDLYNDDWPIRTWQFHHPPAKFMPAPDGGVGTAVSSLVCSGALVEGGQVSRSILSPGVRVRPGAVVEGAVLFDGVEIGVGTTVRRVILDKQVRVLDGASIGLDATRDADRFTVSPEGIVVVGKGEVVE